MNKIVACLSGLTLAVAVTAAHAEAPSANKPPQTAASVMACMRANIPTTMTVKDVQLDDSEANGRTRTMKGKLYATRDYDPMRAVLRLETPRERKDDDEG